MTWKTNSFRYLGINFSLNVKALYELNFIPKLTQIQQIIIVGVLEIYPLLAKLL